MLFAVAIVVSLLCRTFSALFWFCGVAERKRLLYEKFFLSYFCFVVGRCFCRVVLSGALFLFFSLAKAAKRLSMREIFFAKRARETGSFLCPHPRGRDRTDCCLSRQE
jgi:hypothetical protein